MLGELEELATSCRDLVKDVDLVFKLATRAIDAAEKEAAEKNGELKWNRRAIGKLEKELDARRKELVEQLKAVSYFERQAHWLFSRFPDAQLVDVPGLVKLVNRKEIEAADWSLTPGRYVGVAPPEVDEDFDFEEALREIHVELADLNREAAGAGEEDPENFKALGVCSRTSTRLAEICESVRYGYTASASTRRLAQNSCVSPTSFQTHIDLGICSLLSDRRWRPYTLRSP